MDDTTILRLESALLVGKGLDGSTEAPEPLRAATAELHIARNTDDALIQVGDLRPQLVILRESIPVSEGLAFVNALGQVCPSSLVVAVTSQADVKDAVLFVRAGVKDYVAGPLTDELALVLLAGLKAELCQAGDDAKRFFCEDCPPGVPIVGKSPAVRRTLQTIRLVAQSRCNPVLILGETGTGKELAARAVHAWRCGEGQDFVAVNCAALTASLLESELFGHVKGAFTGADRDKTGLFELAGRGTLFLDEISEMPRELQAKLLRVLQERTFRKVGGTKDLLCRANIVASSNRDLLRETNDGKFRKDLYYRLAVFPITLQSLRTPNRREDIARLAEFFTRNSEICPRRDVSGLTDAAVRKLTSHNWPGNVRELKNVIDRALIVEPTDWVGPESIQLDGADVASEAQVPTELAPQQVVSSDPKAFSLETAEREFILRALKETGWQRTRAAGLLGITRATLHAKLKRYDIQPPDSKGSLAGGRASHSRLAAAPAGS
jgi:DNA-binding NtrC family response regulator